MTKTETRPLVRVEEDALREISAFAERHDISRADVYGYAIEALADQVEESKSEQIADRLRGTE